MEGCFGGNRTTDATRINVAPRGTRPSSARTTGVEKLEIIQSVDRRRFRTEKGAVTLRTLIRHDEIVRDFLNTIGAQARAPREALTTDATQFSSKEWWLSGDRSRGPAQRKGVFSP